MSSSIGTLFGAPSHPAVKAPRAVAAYAGLDIDLTQDFVHEDSTKLEFVAKFPPGYIPAFEGKDGCLLSEPVAICQYLASLAPNSGLLGHDAKDAALVLQWTNHANTKVYSLDALISLMMTGVVPYNKTLHTAVGEWATVALTVLNNHLATRTFFVGERITLADIVVANSIFNSVSLTLDAPSRAKYPHVIRHFETIINQPKLKAVYGEPQYVDKAVQYVPPAKEKTKEKKEKPAAAAAAAAAPKAEKKPKPKPDVADDDDEEPLVPAEPKVKNPLDDLPKSTFNLEDWKRAYSNKDTRGPNGSLEWFYQNFDNQGFSIWRVDFKYNSELTLTFMSSNQIGGFYNRLEASRKYLFGSIGVLGESGNSVISGVFILRGQEYKPVVEVAPDWESYEYTKLDLGNPAQKSYFEAALAWDLDIEGKKWVDGKNFK